MKKTIYLLIALSLLLPAVSCGGTNEIALAGIDKEKAAAEPNDTVAYTGQVPEDFYFTVRFGTYGESSYDSRSGKLIKTGNATHPEDYVTTLILSEDEMREIYGMIRRININTYPDRYDPVNDPESDQKVMSNPSATLSLTAKYGSVAKTVYCPDVAFGCDGYNEKAQAFLDCIYRIKDIIVDSEEWRALPDYEFYYC
ncbi:MAG: hypothetical protein IJF13_09480 [Clostridia bacterium]|nr:hypothetical protein [Clostridia bacterium]